MYMVLILYGVGNNDKKNVCTYSGQTQPLYANYIAHVDNYVTFFFLSIFNSQLVESTDAEPTDREC